MYLASREPETASTRVCIPGYPGTHMHTPIAPLPARKLQLPLQLVLLLTISITKSTAEVLGTIVDRPCAKKVNRMISGITTVKTVAILFGIKGGLSDVGKFAAQHALKMPGVTVRPIALSLEAEEGNDFSIQVDVKDEGAQMQLQNTFSGIQYETLDIGDPSAQGKLEVAFKGVDAVVSCIGNRQNHAKWCTLGSQKITTAMKAAKAKRIIQLSSMGVGDDYLPLSLIKVLWGCMLSTTHRSVYKDLVEMEATVMSSNLDFVIVRPMGIDPAEKPMGTWKILTKRGEGNLPITCAKQDVALFMVTEALNPSLHKTFITIGKC